MHRFDQTDRDMSFKALSGQCFDLLVIGGGITGAGVARDAAMRGLSVALIEAQDLASGTSSRSSKMIHGGLRYLVACLLYTSPSPRDVEESRMPSSA